MLREEALTLTLEPVCGEMALSLSLLFFVHHIIQVRLGKAPRRIFLKPESCKNHHAHRFRKVPKPHIHLWLGSNGHTAASGSRGICRKRGAACEPYDREMTERENGHLIAKKLAGPHAAAADTVQL